MFITYFISIKETIIIMNLLNASKMDYVQLSKEIEKTKKKISNLQETVRILEKLQIAEQARHNKQNTVEGKHQWK